jgi:hypothetical protein
MSKKDKFDYKEEIKYWFDCIRTQTDDFTKFEYFYDNKYKNETNILNGSAGLGLVILALQNNMNMSWVRFFNLN